jgi:hypothetical protein
MNMKTNLIIRESLAVLAVAFTNLVQAQNLPVAHWINAAGSNIVSVLNSNLNVTGVFVTDFKGRNDLTVTRLTGNSIASISTNIFGGASPGNNPAWLTHFMGLAANGTGDGMAGDIQSLLMTWDSTGKLQFDFLYPLTPQDRILFTDVDGSEQYLLQAYLINGSISNQVSFVGWPAINYSGSMGIMPDSRWPIWNPSAGTLVTGATEDLNSELFVLTPAQNINRLVITKLNGTDWATFITFVSLQNPLEILKSGTNVVLTWTNSAFALQAAPAVTGSYTNIPGATSPYTNAITAPQEFFRLNAN